MISISHANKFNEISQFHFNIYYFYIHVFICPFVLLIFLCRIDHNNLQLLGKEKKYVCKFEHQLVVIQANANLLNANGLPTKNANILMSFNSNCQPPWPSRYVFTSSTKNVLFLMCTFMCHTFANLHILYSCYMSGYCNLSYHPESDHALL